MTAANFINAFVLLAILVMWFLIIVAVIPRMEVSGKAKFWMTTLSVVLAGQAFASTIVSLTGAAILNEDVPNAGYYALLIIGSRLLEFAAFSACLLDFWHYWKVRRRRGGGYPRQGDGD